MYAQSLTPLGRRRRGVVLVLILAMLSIMALIGVTFATLSGQTQVGAQNFALSRSTLQPSDVLDFGLSQLINDSNDPRSSIRGHSLLRDMYGQDAASNGYLFALPDGQPLRVVNAARNPGTAPTPPPGTIIFQILTNIPFDNPNFPSLFGARFQGSVLRLQQWRINPGNGAPITPLVADQGGLGDSYGRITHTFEVLADDLVGGFHRLTLAPVRADDVQPLGGPYRQTAGLMMPDYPPPPTVPPAQCANLFELDSRHMRAFNGSGISAVAPYTPPGYLPTQPYYPNFLFNAPTPTAHPFAPITLAGGYNDPNRLVYQQLDEDYDAPDLENMFMALTSADGQVVIPSFYRSDIIVYDPTSPSDPRLNDWLNYTDADVPNAALRTALNNSKRAKFLRPRAADHPRAGQVTFPDLIPDSVTGKIQFDVDNDGDGIADSVWVDLGFPPQRNAGGKLYKPLFAFMVHPLNGRLPLNTAGNLSKRAPDGTYPPLDPNTGNPAPSHAASKGYSTSEINPQYGMRNPNDPTGLGMLQVMLQGNPNDPSGPIPGRWGEVELLALNEFPRAGRSYAGGSTFLDGLDTNFNTFDFFSWGPPGAPAFGRGFTAETARPLPDGTPYRFGGDLVDAIGRPILPSERFRRFVTPVDPTGNGLVMPYNTLPVLPVVFGGEQDFGGGFDPAGRVGYYLHFRPPGLPTYPALTAAGAPTNTAGLAAVFADLDTDRDGIFNPATDLVDITQNNVNRLHGYESQRNPGGGLDINTGLPRSNLMGRMPWNVGDNKNYSAQTALQTFDPTINSVGPDYTIGQGGLPGASLLWNDPDEMNLYTPTVYDAPFEPKDQEWLLRFGDKDSAQLDDRLARLVPDAFNNPSDPSGSAIRRKLFSTESWDLIHYALANSALPGPPPASGFSPSATLAHGGRRINLNYPLPVSNDPDEPVRHKWINDTYDLLKRYLNYEDASGAPIRTAAEFAELSQFIVNIVDFRDSDATMTRFVNRDLTILPPYTDTSVTPNIDHPASVQFAATPGTGDLVQWGMEFQPVALNEVLAYQFTRINASDEPEPQKRLWIELANVLTKDGDGPNATGGTAADLDLKGWGLVLTQDDPNGTEATLEQERPNSVTGQLDIDTIRQYFVPLRGTGRGLSADPQELIRKVQALRDDRRGLPQSLPDQQGPGGDNHYLMANRLDDVTDEQDQPSTDALIEDELIEQLPLFAEGSGRREYLWVHLIRPANPNAVDMQAEINADRMVVVDSFRFPYMESGGTVAGSPGMYTVTPGAENLYSFGRSQPFRGGHAIPGGAAFEKPFAHGFDEQTSRQHGNDADTMYGLFRGSNVTGNDRRITAQVRHSLGKHNTTNEDWKHLTFLDRDFTSVAELLMVPGCPPGLFTKQFVERPGRPNRNPATGPYRSAFDNGDGYTVVPTQFDNNTHPDAPGLTSGPVLPYLADHFFYVNPGLEPPVGVADISPLIYKPTGWHRMLELFEVPSPAFGAIGPAEEGQNGDWLRQDTRPGQLNVNAIVDEEVFAGLLEDPRVNNIPAFTDPITAAFPYDLSNPSAAWPLLYPDGITPTTRGVSGIPRVVTAILPDGRPSFTYPISNLDSDPLGRGYYDPVTNTAIMKAFFSDFLKVRHGGSGLVFSAFSTARPVWSVASNEPFAALQALPDRPFRSLSQPNIHDTILRPARLYDISERFERAGGTYANGNLITEEPAARRPQTIQVPPRRLFQIPDQAPAVPAPPANPSNNPADLYDTPYRGEEPPPRYDHYPPDHSTLTAHPVIDLVPVPAPGDDGKHPSLVDARPNPDLNLPDGMGNIDPNGGTKLLGSNKRYQDPDDPLNTIQVNDRRRHPYFRTEWLQKLMNLTTVRSHQYGVWVTVGFFEVVREGNPQMIGVDPVLAMDELGPEIGRESGEEVRYRAFYLIDRTRATGWNPAQPEDFRKVILHERRIE